MKCISEEIRQLYIDNELNQSERSEIERHLSSCPECLKKLEEQMQLISFLKETGKDESRIEIPVFNIPVKQPKPFFGQPWKRYLYLAAACCISLLFFTVYPLLKDKSDKQEYFILYGVENGFDSNLPYSEQEVYPYLIDKDGNIVEIN